jgi:SH3-like domain-containing protein
MRVVRDHEPIYPDPIVLRPGDRVRLGREDDEFPGWVWCTAPDGREGWVPLAILRREGLEAVARRDYRAVELAVKRGQRVEAREELSGWFWVADADAREGWVPAECLAPDRG